MEEKIIHGYAAEKLESLLSLWEQGELPEDDVSKLDELITNLEEGGSLFQEVVSSLSPDTKGILDTYMILQGVRLSEEESAKLDAFVDSLAAQERKSLKITSPVRRWLVRLSVGISAACLLSLFGIYIFLDKGFQFGKDDSRLAVVSENDTLESQVKGMLAMESGFSSGDLNPVSASEKTETYNSVSNTSLSKTRKRKIKKSKMNSAESELERCRRLMREMNLNSNSVSKDALIMLNADFEGSISSKVIVVEMLREFAPKEILKF